ncbi:MAG: SulP family inorganic anion transporter, partial [Candidatus Doudnabacteria bacterium]|nr:SulP family inorganic anion transporter [Candidatus Doudnabacteria bacterium]
MSNPWIQKISQNWKAGFTVALISIPLSISLAIASGAPPTTGLITAVWAGLIAAIFGGSNYNVVGPAGALTGILAAYALLYGADTLAMVALVAGVLILLSWIFKLERFLVFVPGSTIHGFTLSVAIIIALNQLNAALGLIGLEKHEQFLLNIWETLQHLGSTSLPALITFSVGLLFLFASLKLTPKIPGAITIAPIGILLGYIVTNITDSFSLATVGTTYPNLSTSLFNFPHITFNQDILVTGAAVAFVAILETMLSAKIADGMTKTTYNERKEMLGLGLANLASGAAGGLPATGVLVRTALNVRTGATHKIASGINAVLVGIFSIILFHWFSYLPMAIIAAILVFAAIRMVGAEHFVRYFKYDKVGFALAMLVTAVSIYKDPTMGLLVGIGASLLVFMEKLSRGQCELI